MSVMAAGQADMKMKMPVPEEIIELTNEEITIKNVNDNEYCAEFDGNWRLDNVIDSLRFLKPYIESGSISYWSDEGEANADFINGEWCDEWQETYYTSDLPNWSLSSTERVAKILNIIANDMMACSDASSAVELLLKKCELTENEIKLYKLEWLNDLK